MSPVFTLSNYVTLITNPLYRSLPRFNLEVTAIVLAGSLLAPLPLPIFLARVVKSETLETTILLLAILPFGTSYLFRTIAWLPMLSRQRLINIILMKAGIISEPAGIFLYTVPSWRRRRPRWAARPGRGHHRYFLEPHRPLLHNRQGRVAPSADLSGLAALGRLNKNGGAQCQTTT